MYVYIHSMYMYLPYLLNRLAKRNTAECSISKASGVSQSSESRSHQSQPTPPGRQIRPTTDPVSIC